MVDFNRNEFLETQLKAEKTADEVYVLLSKKMKIGILEAVRQYKQFLVETGRELSNTDKRNKMLAGVEAALKGVTEVTDFNTLVASVITSTGASKASVAKAVEGYCKEAEITFTVPERTSVTGEVYQWLLTNKDCTKQEFFDWMATSDRKKSTTAAYWSNFQFAHKCFSAWST